MKIDWHVYRDTGNRWLALTSTLLLTGVWAATTVFIRAKTDITPLHYTIYFGIDLSAPANRLWLLPAFATISWLSHLLIARQPVGLPWTRAWLMIGVLIETLLLAAIVSLIIFARTS